jgi:hypothetical protein
MSPKLDYLRQITERTLEAFIEDWYGPRRPEYGFPPGDLAQVPLPRALKDFYRFAGAWPGILDSTGYRLYRPGQLEADQDKLIFFQETQGVQVWGTLPDQDDPPVWGWSTEPGEPWIAEDEPLSRFLLQAVLLEAAGSPQGAYSDLTGEELRRLLPHFEEIPLAPWGLPISCRFRLYFRPGVIAAAHRTNETPESGFSIVIGALEHGDLEFLEPFAGYDWLYYTPSMTKDEFARSRLCT